MSATDLLLHPVSQRLALTLLHFLWQGVAVVACTMAVQSLWGPRPGPPRYAAYLVSFLIMAACPVVTFPVVEDPPPMRPRPTTASWAPVDVRHDTTGRAHLLRRGLQAGAMQVPTPAVARATSWRDAVDRHVQLSLPWISAAWAVGVGLLSLRLLLGIAGVGRWRRHLSPLPEDMQGMVAALAERMGLPGFRRAFLSQLTPLPIAVGYVRPIILLPASMVSQLPPTILQAFIAHELAHIRRLDLWVNLFQRLVETLLFYHPAVWWLSRRLRAERELCCDELAVAATGQRLTYALALERASRTAMTHAPPPPLGVALGRREMPILERVRHVLGLADSRPQSRWWLAGLLTPLVVLGIGGAERMVRSTDISPIAATVAAAPGRITRMVLEVRREDGKAWIEGVEALGFGRNRDNQFMGAFATTMHAMGNEVSYEHLMGVSGAAFRLHFWLPYWCPSSPDLRGGFDHTALVMEAMGYAAEIHECSAGDVEAAAGLRHAVVTSINAGRPAIGQNLLGKGRYSVIVGYEDDGERFLCRTYDDEQERYSRSTAWPWIVYILDNRTGEPDRRETILRSLATAVRLAETKVYERDGQSQASGFAAYEKWMGDLLNGQLFEEVNQENRLGMAQVNGWIYMCLLDARRAAAAYLKSIAPEFDDSAAAELRKAAALYGQIADGLARASMHAPRPWDQLACEDWSRSVTTRHSQASVLRESLLLETQAVEHISRALAAEGVVTSARSTPRGVGRPVMLQEVSDGEVGGPALIGGLTMVLKYCGVRIDRDTLCGDLGMAFILQASDEVPRYDGALDVGWWPLATECVPVLLEQLSPTVGLRFECTSGVGPEEYKRDPAAYYRKYLHGAIVASLDAGRPALENHAFWEVVVGYDNEPLPLLSFCPCPRGQMHEVARLQEYPFTVVTVTDSVPRVDRKRADLEGLRRVVALGRDQMPMPGGYRTGQRAFALWADTLRDTVNLGQARYHANVVGHLRVHRRSAVNYLEAMAARLPAAMGTHLGTAAGHYGEVLAELETADTSRENLIESMRGRLAFAELVDRIAAIEMQAIDGIERALAAARIESAPAMRGASRPVRMEFGKVPGNIKREGDTVWLDVDRFYPDRHKQPNTVYKSMAIALQAMGQQLSYELLMGISGAAFRLQLHDEWCPSSPHPHCGFNCDVGLSKALAYETTEYSCKADDLEGVEATKASVVACIEMGYPVLMSGEETGLVVGYIEGGKELLIRPPYSNRGEEAVPLDRWPWGFYAIRKVPKKPDREDIVGSLRLAIRLARTEERFEGRYASGFAAYEAWISDLVDASGAEDGQETEAAAT